MNIAELIMEKPYLSVVIPVYNEAGNLDKLYDRLISVLESIRKPYEVIFTNDGSKDNSLQILEGFYKRKPQQIKVIDFKGNFGQHMAVMAGFEQSVGAIVITLDADLQNPPEEIPKLIAKMEEGYDLVSGVRQKRKDTRFRRYASALKRKILAKTTKIQLSDDGCMLRAYHRDIIDTMVATKEHAIYIPALAYIYASRPTEVTVQHDARGAGKSQYRFYDLLRLYFNLMTGYSLLPLQVFTVFGFVVAILSTLFFVFLMLRRIFIGPEAEGVFTLFAIMFFLLGVVLMGMGITGEYIGRIYQEVRKRPRFVIRKILGEKK
jgi:undecaprenyl-phosphate 4-deoxy-4-formamido-L-arabinose transferase